MTEMDVDGLQFEMEIAINNTISVNLSKFDIVIDEDGQATTTTSRPIAAEECISGEDRIRSLRTKFRLLNARSFYVVFMEEYRKFSLRRVDTVDVDLENTWSGNRWWRTRTTRRRRRRRPRIGLDAGDEEEEEDEPTSQRV